MVRVAGGCDTQKDLHMAAVVERDDAQLLVIKEFSTTRAGSWALLRWMRGHGELHRWLICYSVYAGSPSTGG